MKKVIFVGQAMPRIKRHPHDWPTLNAWLYPLGITDRNIKSNFLYTALVNYFPGAKNGSHLAPTEKEILKERKRLGRTIKKFNPNVVVTIGKLSVSYCLPNENGLLKDFIGKIYEADPYDLFGKKIKIIPFPHPSGASTWRHKPGNKKLLKKALALLKANI